MLQEFWNFELNVEISEPTLLMQLGSQLESEIAASREVLFAEHESRPVTRRFVENLCHLFQPVL